MRRNSIYGVRFLMGGSLLWTILSSYVTDTTCVPVIPAVHGTPSANSGYENAQCLLIDRNDQLSNLS